MDTFKDLFAEYKAELCLPQNRFLIFGEVSEGLRSRSSTMKVVEVDLVKPTQDALKTLDGRIRERNVTVTISLQTSPSFMQTATACAKCWKT